MAYQKPVSTSFWTNKKVLKHLSINDKLLFVYLLTNNHIDQIGIYEIPICLISYETGLTDEEVKNSLSILEQQKMTIYSEETDEVAILNYNKYSLLSGGAVAQKCFNDIDRKVKNKKLLLPVYENLLSINNTCEDSDEKKQDKKSILEYAKRKIKECLEYHGLLNNNTDEKPNNDRQLSNIEVYEEVFTEDNSEDEIIRQLKRDMESNPFDKELYELKIKIREYENKLSSLDYDWYPILGVLKYYDIANDIMSVKDKYQLQRCVKDLENVLNNLSDWKSYYDNSPVYY